MKEKDINRLDHTTWRCQYHVVFAPKYRRMAIYGEIKVDIGKILRQLCQQKGIEIIEAELCRDHVHMLIRIPPKYSVSQIMGYLKGKSSLMIFDRHANLKYKMCIRDRCFWSRSNWKAESCSNGNAAGKNGCANAIRRSGNTNPPNRQEPEFLKSRPLGLRFRS